MNKVILDFRLFEEGGKTTLDLFFCVIQASIVRRDYNQTIVLCGTAGGIVPQLFQLHINN